MIPSKGGMQFNRLCKKCKLLYYSPSGRSGRTHQDRNLEVGPFEKARGGAEGGWPRIAEMVSKTGEQVGWVWDRGKCNRREKFPGQLQGSAVHEVRRAT